MGCLYALLGGLGGAVLFFFLPSILSFGGNLSGLVGLMVVPIGFIVGAVVGGMYWAEHPENNGQQKNEDDVK